MAQKPSHGAARFAKRLSQAQKNALLKAVLIEGRTIADAIRMARGGQLEVPAFEIGVYAYDIVKNGREAFEATHDDALDVAVANELRSAELDALANIRATRATLKRGEANDTSRLATATKDLATIRRARKDATTRIKPPAPMSHNEAEPVNTADPASVVASLLDMAQQGARTGSLPRSPQGTRAA